MINQPSIERDGKNKDIGGNYIFNILLLSKIALIYSMSIERGYNQGKFFPANRIFWQQDVFAEQRKILTKHTEEEKEELNYSDPAP